MRMCGIIDTCVVAALLDKDNAEHANYVPVLKWILYGKGKMVYGGSTYKKELGELRRYLKLIAEVNRAGKIVPVEDAAVDQAEKHAKVIIPHKDFDDPHIAAIVAVSGCRVICTRDGRSIPHLKRKELYPKHIGVPRFYLSVRNKGLLNDGNLIDKCRSPGTVQHEVSLLRKIWYREE